MINKSDNEKIEEGNNIICILNHFYLRSQFKWLNIRRKARHHKQMGAHYSFQRIREWTKQKHGYKSGFSKRNRDFIGIVAVITNNAVVEMQTRICGCWCWLCRAVKLANKERAQLRFIDRPDQFSPNKQAKIDLKHSIITVQVTNVQIYNNGSLKCRTVTGSNLHKRAVTVAQLVNISRL